MTPRTKAQFEEIRENKKALIMRCALDLFAREGYHTTSVAHIAERAQISKGLLYNYFESKEELLKEIINRGLNSISNLMDPDHDGIITTGEMRKMIDEIFHIITEHKKFWILYFSILTQPDVMMVAGEKIEYFFGKIIKMLETYFKAHESKNPKADALLFGALVDGLSFNYLISGRKYPIEQVKERIVELFVK